MNRSIHFVFLFSGAWLVATTLSTVIEAQLPPVPTALKAVRTAAAATASLSLTRLGRLTGLSTAPPSSVQVTASLPSRFDARLLGTLIDESRPALSLAELLSPRAGRAMTYAIGEHIDGAEVVSIERARVWVRLADGRSAFIEGGVFQPQPVALGPVRQRSESEFELTRDDLFKAISQYPSDASRPTLVPVLARGVPTGVRVELKPGSMYASLGLQSGDVIRRINGEDLSTVMSRGLEWVGRLRSLPRIELELERGGALIRREYALQ